jgi:DNA-binding NtrC family response regulator
VLVVEPDIAFRNFVALALTRRGYEVECVGSGGHARALVSRPFTVVVCQEDLADELSGVEILTLFRLRARARTILLSRTPARGELPAVDLSLSMPCPVVAIIQAVERLSPSSAAGGAPPRSF